MAPGLPVVPEVADPSPAEPAPAVQAEPPSAPAPARGPRTHKVQAGDNLYTLAQRYYGDGEKWMAIKEANPGKVSKHHGLSLGTDLLIP